jgi:hypothetical protein
MSVITVTSASKPLLQAIFSVTVNTTISDIIRSSGGNRQAKAVDRASVMTVTIVTTKHILFMKG